jgi:hypothetical protein
MAEITTAFMMPFRFPATSYSILAVDNLGTNTRNISVGVLWHNIEFAASFSPSGLQQDVPINLLKIVELALNAGGANYVVSLDTSGRVAITNTDIFTNATLTFSSTDLAFALGFISVGPHLIITQNTIYSDYQPTHCLFAYARENDTGWQSKGQIYAVADLPDGNVYGWGNGSARFTRTFNLKYHPKDVNYVSGLLSNITPAYPSIIYNNTQWKTPTQVPTLRPPWTVHNFLNAAVYGGEGTIIAACLGNFQANINTTDLSFEQITLNAESIKAEHFSLSIPNYDRFRNVDNFTVNFFAHKTRDAS